MKKAVLLFLLPLTRSLCAGLVSAGESVLNMASRAVTVCKWHFFVQVLGSVPCSGLSMPSPKVQVMLTL